MFNLAAAPLQLFGLGRLSESAILAAAQKSTGLNQLGDKRFRHPLRLLIEDYSNDKALTLLGRLIAKGMLTSLVANRMLVQAHFAQKPEIAKETLQHPLFIVGLPRSGTSFLYNLLGQDQSFRSLLFWESCSPASPEITGRKDQRIAHAIKTVKGLNRALPELKSIHEFNATAPDECTGLLLNTFTTPYFRGRLPKYRQWLFGAGQGELPNAYSEYEQQLQLLQFSREPKPWLLKSPSHLFGLTQLLERLPSARVIYLRRPLDESVASLCSLSRALDSLSYGRVDESEIGQRTLGIVNQFLQGGLAACRSSHASRIEFLDYQDLVTSPLDQVKKVYASLNQSLSPETLTRMSDYVKSNRRSGNNVHHYQLADFGLDASDLASMQELANAIGPGS